MYCAQRTQAVLILHLTQIVYFSHTLKALLQPLQHNSMFLALFIVYQVLGQSDHEPAEVSENLPTNFSALELDLEEVELL